MNGFLPCLILHTCNIGTITAYDLSVLVNPDAIIALEFPVLVTIGALFNIVATCGNYICAINFC